MEAFGTLGFSACDSGDLEAGLEKIAIYADASGTPTHAARKTNTGRWSSKHGRDVDIEHDLNAIAGALYGQAVQFLAQRHAGHKP